jgi:glycosyltransferase involved in cell wall biosynthesis
LPYSTVRHAGGKTVYEIIKKLSESHEIHIFSRVESDEKLYEFKTPRDSNPLKSILIIVSYIILSLKANRIVNKEYFDIVQVEHTETGLFFKKRKDIVMILDAHDVLSKPAMRRYLSAKWGLQRLMGWLKWIFVKKIEKYITRKFDLTFTRSQIDKEILLNFNPHLKIKVIPHPVEPWEPVSDFKNDENMILYIGAMNRDLNQDAVLYFHRSVFPLVKMEIPDVKFYIVGNSPSEKIKELAMNDQDVVVTGFVESLVPYYQRATIFVSPILIGGGIIAKNIEAMACGLPLITTSIGNEGIEAVPERNILIADTPEDFREKVILLLKNKEMRRKIGDAGRAFVREKFNLKRIIDKIESSWDEIAITNPRKG